MGLFAHNDDREGSEQIEIDASASLVDSDPDARVRLPEVDERQPAATRTAGPDLSRPLRAFASYSWAATDDVTSVGDLVAEMRMRAFATFRDRDSLGPGTGIEATVLRQLPASDVVVPYLTPHALDSDPVVEMEFRAAAALERDHGRPRLMPILRNLGTSHQEVTHNTFDRLHHDFRARWTGQIAPAGDNPLPRELTARYAADALRAALPDGEGPADGRWRLMLATRGDRPAPWPLTVDATERWAARFRSPATARPGRGCSPRYATSNAR
jgi:hypothetical protein